MAGRKKKLSPGTLAGIIVTMVILTAVLLFLFLARTGGGRDIEELIAQMTDIPAENAAVGVIGGADGPTAIYIAESKDVPEKADELPETEAADLMPSEGFTIAAAGSINVPRTVREFALEGNHYDFSTVFLGLGQRFAEADLSLCTLETMTDERQSYDSMNAPNALLDALRNAGVDLTTLATEHMLDKGYDGLDVTQAELVSRGILCAGVRQEEALPGVLLPVGGIRTAVLSYTYGISEEGSILSHEDRLGVVPVLSDEASVIRDIVSAKAQGAELVVLLVHWGVKNSMEVPESLRQMAVQLAEAGADLILGTHPNVPQPVQHLRVTRADGLEYDAYVAYSLGSLLTDARSPESATGMILRFVAAKETDGRVSVRCEEIIPTFIARQEENGDVSWRIVEADNEASVAVLGERERMAAGAAAARIREIVQIPEGEEIP